MLSTHYYKDGFRDPILAQLKLLPDTCPYCNKGVELEYKHSYGYEIFLQAVFKCPINGCKKIFIGNYVAMEQSKNGTIFHLKDTEPMPDFKEKKVSDEIKEISVKFHEIYLQAEYAEQCNLSEICGMGYRKALEFLIKDYIITKIPEKKDEILQKFLGNCIKDHIDNPRIKSMAERAVWIGNDETHYLRKHVDKDVQDLKKLIEITMYWIMMEITSDSYENEIQGKK